MLTLRLVGAPLSPLTWDPYQQASSPRSLSRRGIAETPSAESWLPQARVQPHRGPAPRDPAPCPRRADLPTAVRGPGARGRPHPSGSPEDKQKPRDLAGRPRPSRPDGGAHHRAGVLSRGPVSLGSTVRQAEAGHPSCTGTVSPGKGSALPAGPGQPAAGGAQQRGVTPNPAPSTDRKQRGCSGRDQPLRWAKVLAPEGGCEPTAGTGGVGVAGIHLPFGEPQKRKILINLNLICFSSNQL